MNARQLHYLRSMDIDVWQRRELVQEHTTSLPVHINGSITKSPVEPIVEAAQREPVSDLVAKSAQRFDPNVLVTPSLETWNDVELAVSHCIRCTLHTSRTQTVFGVGDRNAKWMI